MVWSMSRRKDISYDHRRAVIAAHQSGTSYKAFSKQFSSPPFYSETDSSQVWNIEGSRQSCLVWTSQQLHHEARLRCSEKLQKETQKLHLRTPQASVSMWNAKVQDSRVIKKKKDWTGMAFLEGLSGESLFSLYKEHGSTAWIVVTPGNTTGLLEQCPFWKMREKWRCLVIMHSSTFGENQTQLIDTYALSSTVGEGLWFWLVSTLRSWAPWSFWVKHKLFCIPKCSG